MDDEQVRFLLGACQPSGADASQPEVVEAFEQARHDPHLAAWLQCERSSDVAIARKLRELEPPRELRSRLLAGGRASRRASTWRRWHLPLGLAASLLLAAAITWVKYPEALRHQHEQRPLLSWQRACVGIFSSPFFSLDLTDTTYPPLEAHLVKCGAPVAGELPFSDAIVSALGCKVLEWNGTTVSLACFHAGTGELVHLFVMPRGGVDETLIRGHAHREQVGGYATVTWLHGDLVVMVASKLPPSELERVLAQRTTVARLASTSTTSGS